MLMKLAFSLGHKIKRCESRGWNCWKEWVLAGEEKGSEGIRGMNDQTA